MRCVSPVAKSQKVQQRLSPSKISTLIAGTMGPVPSAWSSLVLSRKTTNRCARSKTSARNWCQRMRCVSPVAKSQKVQQRLSPLKTSTLIAGTMGPVPFAWSSLVLSRKTTNRVARSKTSARNYCQRMRCVSPVAKSQKVQQRLSPLKTSTLIAGTMGPVPFAWSSLVLSRKTTNRVARSKTSARNYCQRMRCVSSLAKSQKVQQRLSPLKTSTLIAGTMGPVPFAWSSLVLSRKTTNRVARSKTSARNYCQRMRCVSSLAKSQKVQQRLSPLKTSTLIAGTMGPVPFAWSSLVLSRKTTNRVARSKTSARNYCQRMRCVSPVAKSQKVQQRLSPLKTSTLIAGTMGPVPFAWSSLVLSRKTTNRVARSKTSARNYCQRMRCVSSLAKSQKVQQRLSPLKTSTLIAGTMGPVPFAWSSLVLSRKTTNRVARSKTSARNYCQRMRCVSSLAKSQKVQQRLSPLKTSTLIAGTMGPVPFAWSSLVLSRKTTNRVARSKTSARNYCQRMRCVSSLAKSQKVQQRLSPLKTSTLIAGTMGPVPFAWSSLVLSRKTTNRVARSKTSARNYCQRMRCVSSLAKSQKVQQRLSPLKTSTLIAGTMGPVPFAWSSLVLSRKTTNRVARSKTSARNYCQRMRCVSSLAKSQKVQQRLSPLKTSTLIAGTMGPVPFAWSSLVLSRKTTNRVARSKTSARNYCQRMRCVSSLAKSQKVQQRLSPLKTSTLIAGTMGPVPFAWSSLVLSRKTTNRVARSKTSARNYCQRMRCVSSLAKSQKVQQRLSPLKTSTLIAGTMGPVPFAWSSLVLSRKTTNRVARSKTSARNYCQRMRCVSSLAKSQKVQQRLSPSKTSTLIAGTMGPVPSAWSSLVLSRKTTNRVARSKTSARNYCQRMRCASPLAKSQKVQQRLSPSKTSTLIAGTMGPVPSAWSSLVLSRKTTNRVARSKTSARNYCQRMRCASPLAKSQKVQQRLSPSKTSTLIAGTMGPVPSAWSSLVLSRKTTNRVARSKTSARNYCQRMRCASPLAKNQKVQQRLSPSKTSTLIAGTMGPVPSAWSSLVLSRKTTNRCTRSKTSARNYCQRMRCVSSLAKSQKVQQRLSPSKASTLIAGTMGPVPSAWSSLVLSRKTTSRCTRSKP